MSGRNGPRRSHLTALAFAAFAVSSCQGGFAAPRPAASTATSALQTSTLRASQNTPVPADGLRGTTITVWHPWFGVEASLFESQVEQFNRENEWGIRVRIAGQGSYNQMYDAMTGALPTDERPQIAVGMPEYAIEWEQAGYVVDLNQYVQDATYGLTVEEQRDFPSVFWAQDVVGGRRLGMPAERGAQFLAYNTSWAGTLGYDSAPATADQLRSQACAAHSGAIQDQSRANDAEGGWLTLADTQTLLSWMMAFGGGVLEGSGYHFLTPKNLAAITYVKQLYEDGCAWAGLPEADVATAFAQRRALFADVKLEALQTLTRAMAAENNSDDWTVLPYPGPDQQGLAVYGSSYVVLQSTPQQQLASWLLIRWLLLPQNQNKWVEVTGLFPLRNSMLGPLQGYESSHPQWAAAADLVSAGQIEPQLASWRQVRVMVGDGFDAMFRTNTSSGRVAEVLAIMEKTATDLSK
jgi:ABC-type glycerol-3-phosphate transport system substrate-binding protein